MTERLYILDAHSLIYQVFHAIPEMTGPAGLPTNAVFGFVRDLQFLRKQKKPDYLVCAFDSPGPTFRHEIYPEYKANRSEMPGDLRSQIDVIREILDAYHIPVLAQPGIEADDFLASVAHQAGERRIEAFLCTADKDMRQAISDHACVYDLRRNRVLDRAFLESDWGVTPEQVIDYQAMVGDATDNVPGIPGIGPKTASSLLQKYGTFEGICAHVDEIPRKGVRTKILQGKASIQTGRQLVRLRTDLELPESWESWRRQDPDVDRLLDLFAKCGFHRFADELRSELPDEGSWESDYQLVSDAAGLDRLLGELAPQRRFSVDLETTSLHPTEAEIVGIALAWEPGRAYYIALRAPEGETSLQPDQVLGRLRPLLEDAQIEKVGQNLKYDLIVLRRVGILLRGIAFDSMVGSYLLEPGERNHNLDELSQRLLNHQTIKITELIGERKAGQQQCRMDQVEAERVAAYAGEDADVALRLTNLLEPRLRQEGLAELFADLECPLIEVLGEMEYNGIRIDPEMLADQSREYGERLASLKEHAYELAGHDFNLDSPKQLRVILFEELGLPVVKRTKSGPSTDQAVLEELADQHPLCALLIEHRKLTKLKGTYLDALPAMVHPQTGRIHASFNQTVTATGRLSSSEPNLQNIPVRTEEGRQIRAAFVPGASGQVLLSADYSQIELRLLAHFSKDAALCRAFAEDRDIHAVVAAQIGGTDLEGVSSEMRRRAKAVNFGIMYGQSPFGLARQLKIPQDEAAKFIDAYFEQYPGIEDFFESVLESAKAERAVRTILGRHRPITGIKNTTGRTRNLPERTAINTVIQGSAADLIKQAMLNVHRRLQPGDFGARMLLQIHDELVFEVDRERLEALAAMVDEEMTTALTLDGVPLKVDIGFGPNWLDLQPLELAARAEMG